MVYETYTVRWLLIVLVSSPIFIRGFIARDFSNVNGVEATYFKTNRYLIDIFDTVDPAICVVVCLAMILLGDDALGLFSVALLNTIIFLSGTVLVLIGYVVRSSYYLVALGAALSEIPVCSMLVITPVLAARWFSKDNTATALSFPFFSWYAGFCLSAILFQTLTDQRSQNNASNITEYHVIKDRNYEETVFVSTYGTCCGLAFLTFVLTVYWMTNEPPTPPSSAQEHVIKNRTSRTDMSIRQHMNIQWEIVVDLFSHKSFLIFMPMQMLSSSYRFVFTLLLFAFRKDLSGFSSQTTQQLLVSVLLFAAIGSLTMGRIVDKFKKFKLIIGIGWIVQVLSSFVIYFGIKYRNIAVIFVGFSLGGFWLSSIIILQLELLIETTYPSNKLVLSSLFFGVAFTFDLIFKSISLSVIKNVNETYVLLFGLVLAYSALMLLYFTDTKYKRMEIEMQAEGERKRLLSVD